MTALTAKTDQGLSTRNKLATSVPATVIGQNQGHQFPAAVLAQRIATDQPGSLSRSLLIRTNTVRLRAGRETLATARKRENCGLRVLAEAPIGTGISRRFLADQCLRIIEFVRPENSHGDALP